MSEPDLPTPIYVDSFRVDVGTNGIILITFVSPVATLESKAPRLRPTVSVAMTENKLAELEETLAGRRKKGAVLRLKPAPDAAPSA